jgi:hypothetical protein
VNVPENSLHRRAEHEPAGRRKRRPKACDKPRVGNRPEVAPEIELTFDNRGDGDQTAAAAPAHQPGHHHVASVSVEIRERRSEGLGSMVEEQEVNLKNDATTKASTTDTTPARRS